MLLFVMLLLFPFTCIMFLMELFVMVVFPVTYNPYPLFSKSIMLFLIVKFPFPRAYIPKEVPSSTERLLNNCDG